MRCIKTILSPHLTKQNSLVFRSQQPSNEETPFSWNSGPILINNTYKVKFKLEIHNERYSPAKSSSIYARPTYAMMCNKSQKSCSATATLYAYNDHDHRGQSLSLLTLQKEIRVEIKFPESQGILLTLNLCAQCKVQLPPRVEEVIRDMHGEMEAVACITSQVQIKHCYLSDVTIVLYLQDHVHENITRI